MNRLRTAEGRWVRVRMGIICGLLALGTGFVVSAGYSVMARDGQEWRELAERQRQRRLRLAPKRGSVYDRNGSPLAISIDVPSVSMDAMELLRGVTPQEVPVVARSAAERIATALGLEAPEVERKILRQRRFAWLKRRITQEEAEKLQELEAEPRSPGEEPIRGLLVEAEGQRYYPQRALGGPLLGFVAPDGTGKDGLELSLDQELGGQREMLKGLRDRSGHVLFLDGIQDERAMAGHDLYLTIDQGIQNLAEQELARAAQTFEALSASVVVVAPQTGEILALATWPSYNPNDYRFSEMGSRRLRGIADRFEPGSSMKIFTLAAGLETAVVRPNELMFCENGSMKVDGVTIPDTHPAGWLSVSQALALSSNICLAKVGMKVGGQRLHDAFRRFGFGEETGVPLPGEATGVLLPRSRPWVQVETATAAFGHGISVTNLQLAMATAAIANGGRLMEPILVRRVQSGTGELVREATPRVRRQAVPASVARTVAEMMIAVTEGNGTGVQARVNGFSVSGKTGTAQKADPRTGRYSQDNYVASFVGFVPARRPVLAMAVTIDEPMVEHSGGAVAAPVFRRIAEGALTFMGVTPEGRQATDVQKLVGIADPARRAYEVIERGRSQPSLQQVHEPQAMRPGTVRIPDLTGFPVREAVRKGIELGVKPRVVGTGLLGRQEPAPGSVLEKGETLVLVFEPAS
ncbi:MAG: Peptidoglycan glycosyltransferase [Pseudomonadota bacterium]|jgi:cell division protein FtsI (penicillin-binding protein 3)